jgi:hypothetical protein
MYDPKEKTITRLIKHDSRGTSNILRNPHPVEEGIPRSLPSIGNQLFRNINNRGKVVRAENLELPFKTGSSPITDPSKNVGLKYVNESMGYPTDRLVKASKSEDGEDIWIVSDEALRNKDPFENPPFFALTQCYREQCFDLNGLYIFRPDGTFGVYKIDGLSAPSHYTFEGFLYCGNEPGRLYLQVPLLEDESQYYEGYYDKSQKPDLLKVKSEQSSIYKSLSNILSRFTSGGVKGRWSFKKDFILSKVLDLRTVPILLKKDPYGRTLVLLRTDLRPTGLCEPLIYLYSDIKRELSVEIGDRVELIATQPRAARGRWEVAALPDGSIETGGKGYRNIFWEGLTTPLEFDLPDGFVVTKENALQILREKLLRLGLEDREIRDFSRYWVRKYGHFEYAAIRFLSQEEIDSLAPITIAPAPEAVTRVQMVVKELDHWIDLKPQKLTEGPARKSFHAVEWGIINGQ